MSACVACPSGAADRLELDNEGQRISYHPTGDEIALIHFPGRGKEVELRSQMFSREIDRNEMQRCAPESMRIMR